MEIPMINKIFLNSPEASDYLNEAIAAANFIDSRRIDTPNGLYWSIEDAKAGEEVYYDEICLYAGSSGIAHYYLLLWHFTKEDKYLNDANEAAKYIIYRWNHKRELAKNFSMWAFSTGYSGIASFLLELYEITANEEYKAVVEEINREIIANAKESSDGVGSHWCSYPGIVGDAGIILYLLSAAKKLGRSDWKDFAIEAGRRYLSKAIKYEGGGIYYLGVNPEYFHSDENYIDPNYPMGTAGIGFTLLRLYEESNDKAFLDAVNGIEELHNALALKLDDAVLLPHGLPTRPDTYYLGYCHGPAGTARFYQKYYEITGESRYADWAERLANGILRTGAPEVHSPGYWNTHCYCCGTAGFTNLFLGIWAVTGHNEYLKYAERTTRQILGWSSHVKENNKIQAMWHQAFVGTQPKRITTNIGMYDGAAGIGWALLQMYSALTDQFYVQRAVDDPYPERVEFR
jgi:lantibiotic modifying enzyme